MLKKILVLLILTCFTSGCANQAMILSEPPGAEVYIDGQPIGQTPCKYEYSTNTGRSFEVTVQHSGYEPIQHRIAADETDVKARNSWLAAGLVWSPLWLGTFFTKKLKDSYNFVMKKVAPQLTAKVDAPETANSF